MVEVTHPSKIKGSAYERDVVKALRALGFDAERAYGAGRPDDVGDIDIAGVPVAIECKNTQRLDLAGFVDEARTEARNAGVEIGVAIVKRRGRPASESYMVCRLDDGAELLRAYGCTNRAGGER